MAAPRLEFQPVPRWRIAAASPNAVLAVIEGIAALDRPEHFAIHTSWLASRENYPEAAFEIESRVRANDAADRLCTEIILDRRASLGLKTFRLGAPFGLFGNSLTRGVIPKLGPAELIAIAPPSKKRAARVVAALLGYIDYPHGLIPADETSPARPGFWPAAQPSCRLALALNWIARTRHGQRLHWHLVNRL